MSWRKQAWRILTLVRSLHARRSADMLKNAGFTELAEAEPTKETLNRWQYFFTRDKSTRWLLRWEKICRRQRL
jgi:hypothetical protein